MRYRFPFIKKQLIILMLIISGAFSFFTLSLSGQSEPFTSLLSQMGYSEADAAFSQLEIETLNSITHENEIPRYSGRLIRLYLIASGITTEDELKPYMLKYQSLLSSIENKLKTEPSLKNINTYNKAEFILHELHNLLLKTAETGSGAGYNIGITETFDRGLFNCYKSALIYNALLEDTGISSEYVSVPEHIYSLITVEGRKIEVETTNRYGFDPWERGKPEFRRSFDKAGITFPKKDYSSKTITDNITVLVRVYNNRSLLYSGDYKYSRYRPVVSHERSAALSLSGFHINRKTEPYIHEAVLASLFKISEKNIKENPYALDAEYLRYSGLISSGIIEGNLKNAERNIEIFAFNGLTGLREAELSALSSRSIAEVKKIYEENLIAASKYITRNTDLRESFQHNTGVLFNRYLESDLKPENANEIIAYSRHIMSFLNHPSMKGSRKIDSLKITLVTNICIMINNRGAMLINSGRHEDALSELEAGINYLKGDLKEWDRRIIHDIERARDIAKKRLRGRD